MYKVLEVAKCTSSHCLEYRIRPVAYCEDRETADKVATLLQEDRDNTEQIARGMGGTDGEILRHGKADSAKTRYFVDPLPLCWGEDREKHITDR